MKTKYVNAEYRLYVCESVWMSGNVCNGKVLENGRLKGSRSGTGRKKVSKKMNLYKDYVILLKIILLFNIKMSWIK